MTEKVLGAVKIGDRKGAWGGDRWFESEVGILTRCALDFEEPKIIPIFVEEEVKVRWGEGDLMWGGCRRGGSPAAIERAVGNEWLFCRRS